MSSISRRSFVASVSAMFAGAVAANRAIFRKPPPICWDLYTDQWSTRFSLSSPFVAMERTVAVDGRILVSVPGFDSVARNVDGRLPDVSKLNWDEFDSAGWKPSGQLEESAETYEAGCIDCGGTGRVGQGIGLCSECNGDCCELDDPCETCNHTGWVGGLACGRCPGSDQRLVVADGHTFEPALVGRIKFLGEFDWKVSHHYQYRDGVGGLLLFRFGQGGKGFLSCRA